MRLASKVKGVIGLGRKLGYSARLKLAQKLAEKYGISEEEIEETKMQFLNWCAVHNKAPNMENYLEFVRDTKGEVSIVDWVKGIIILAILGVGVGVPIVIQTVNQVSGCVTDPTTALVLGVLPVVVVVGILLAFLGH